MPCLSACTLLHAAWGINVTSLSEICVQLQGYGLVRVIEGHDWSVATERYRLLGIGRP